MRVEKLDWADCSELAQPAMKMTDRLIAISMCVVFIFSTPVYRLGYACIIPQI
jgi:hypothetical protein